MKVSLVGLCLGVLLLSAACTDSKKPPRDPNILRGDDTVYGEGSGSSTQNSTSDELIEEDPTSYTSYSTDGEVESGEIDLSVSMDADPNNLNWEPIYFDFDQDQVTDVSREKLISYSQVLKARPNLRVLLEGHCDHRGTEDYNLALGERRAQSVKRFFLELGVPASQMRTISYGELRPLSKEDNESAWARNRRVSFAF